MQGLLLNNRIHLQRQQRKRFPQKRQNTTKRVFCLSGFEGGWALWSALGGCAVASGVLQDKFGLISPPVAAIGLGACMSWCGVTPANSAIYVTIQQTLVPFALALFLIEQPTQTYRFPITKQWLLLIFFQLKNRILDVGLPMVICFVIGVIGTLLGTLVAWYFASHYLPAHSATKIAAALCATYIGGTLNFVAVSQILNIHSSEVIAAALAADSIGMAIYLVILSVWPVKGSHKKVNIWDANIADQNSQKGMVSTFTAAALVCALSTWLSAKLGQPKSMLVFIPLFTVALKFFNIGRLLGGFQGCGVIATCIMQLFFVTIGASVGSFQLLVKHANILFFVAIQLSVHVAIVVLGGILLRLPFDKLLIASNANIGGPATASGIAISRGWNELAFPAIVLGILGYMIGTACGLYIIHLLN
eukprot:TRINITY_DN11897_c0_g1_i6.p1 TRINITY_DN11897_c0_g1~~TRINITY_DN11897_c0_g1_i6.p1  ORF type:complete len:418 (+),score=46.47 TRINITY_DN11897_c0_g1_i6:152-1405(+)